MIPIVKGWSTEIAQEVTSLGVQVHGGMGFIEETGAAQHYRDARIITIYEGTTGIQANDLIGRKTARDAGAVATAVAAEIDKVAAKLASHADPVLNAIGLQLASSTADLQSAIDWLVPAFAQHTRAAHAGAVPYLKLWGLVAGGWQMGRAALIAHEQLAQRRSAMPISCARRSPPRASTRNACCRRRRATRTRSPMAATACWRCPSRRTDARYRRTARCFVRWATDTATPGGATVRVVLQRIARSADGPRPGRRVK